MYSSTFCTLGTVTFPPAATAAVCVPNFAQPYLAVFPSPPVDHPEPLYSSVEFTAGPAFLPKTAIPAFTVPPVPCPNAYLPLPKDPLENQVSLTSKFLKTLDVELYQICPSACALSGSVVKKFTSFPIKFLYVLIIFNLLLLSLLDLMDLKILL